jgi:hypothetical protein
MLRLFCLGVVSCLVAGVMECTAQINLVPNPSFEDYTDCPFSGSLLQYAVGWVSPTGYTPDYLNACDTTSYNMGVPSNVYGTQYARTGDAYAGIITMIETDSREYIQAQLNSPLLSGYTYEVTFYVSPADVCTYISNDIGAYFSTTPIHSIPANSLLYLPYIPQVQNNVVTNPLNVRDVWTKVSGTFTASGGERYITIGNFKNDSSTDTMHYPTLPTPWWTTSYHYIDDVSVVCLDCPVGITDMPDGNPINVYPNPTSGLLNIYWGDVSSASIEVFNSIGATVFAATFHNSSVQIDVTQYSTGIYFIKADVKEHSIIKPFLIKH